MKVLVTRPRGQAEEWVASLRGLGLDAEALPLIEIAPAPDAAAVARAWQELSHTDLVVFVSPNAVEQFFAAQPEGVSWPATTRVASPGPGTDRELARRGLPAAARVTPPADAEQFDSEALWQLLRHEDWRGRPVLIVRGTSGRNWLAARFTEAGAQVRFVSAYERRTPHLDAAGGALLRRAIERPRQHVWIFSSSESIDHLQTLCEAAGLRPRWPEFLALATHPRIAAAARRAGIAGVMECTPAVADVVRSIQSLAP